MNMPYFKNGDTAKSISERTGIALVTVRGYIFRYKIPRDYYNPEKLINDIHSEHLKLREIGIRPLVKTVSRFISYSAPKRKREKGSDKKESYTSEALEPTSWPAQPINIGDNNSKKTLAVLIRSMEKHSMYTKAFGVDTRDELADVKNKILDDLLME